MSELMSELESMGQDNAARLIFAIDEKFAVGGAKRGGAVREHEESLAVMSTSVLSDCPSVSRVDLVRPRPEEADQAAAMWPTFGGHRVTVVGKGGRTQIDFLACDGEILKRQINAYPDQPLPRSEELQDGGLNPAMNPVEQAAAARKSNIGEVMPPKKVAALLGWVSMAFPKQQ